MIPIIIAIAYFGFFSALCAYRTRLQKKDKGA